MSSIAKVNYKINPVKKVLGKACWKTETSYFFSPFFFLMVILFLLLFLSFFSFLILTRELLLIVAFSWLGYFTLILSVGKKYKRELPEFQNLKIEEAENIKIKDSRTTEILNELIFKAKEENNIKELENWIENYKVFISQEQSLGLSR